MMAYSIEKILSDACRLSTRLREHDTTADSVIIRTQALQRQVEAMKQYQENLNALNEMARHRPRGNLILGLAQENCQIRELQSENKELRQSLEEHQSALELIMSKYREQVGRLMRVNSIDRSLRLHSDDHTKELADRAEKISEMAAVMWRAVEVDDRSSDRGQELITQLRTENEAMRHLLQISTSSKGPLSLTNMDDKVTQTEEGESGGSLNASMKEDWSQGCVDPALMSASVASSLEDSVISSSSTESLTSSVSDTSVIERLSTTTTTSTQGAVTTEALERQPV